MDKLPVRTQLAQLYRQPLHKLERVLPFPIKDPNVYQLLGLTLSVFFLFTKTSSQQIIILSLVLILDWFDGATARKFSLTSKSGYLIDVLVDRFSEGLIFIAVLNSTAGKVFFGFYLLNNILSFYSVKSGKHTIIALRFFYLIFLIIQCFL
jgi:phosphatidylglycerophosphate synthase